MVNLADTMKAFREYIKGFKPKYRVMHNHSLGLPTKVVPLPTAVEVLLYEGYSRRMCMMGEVNFNLNCENLCAFPPSRKLYEYFHLVLVVHSIITMDLLFILFLECESGQGHPFMSYIASTPIYALHGHTWPAHHTC